MAEDTKEHENKHPPLDGPEARAHGTTIALSIQCGNLTKGLERYRASDVGWRRTTEATVVWEIPA